ncbi:PREDICTED: uncharacterized protein LOC108365349 [Rhagoletis zephyria]|uniref:uncharacterized protein LOC108365349 n=1 Tax=Rhagoletis zephyria TaxID=28612 RepID=UPI00081150FF|nr:PREDICTED: uncharacterized protein LOC108365349 [Rhagoletis zephyria]
MEVFSVFLASSCKYSKKMLKYFIIFTVTTFISLTQNVQANDIMKLPMGLLLEGVAPYANKCDPKPELEHMEELFLFKEDAQHATKCFRRCLMDQFELFVEGGTQVHTEKLAYGMLLLYPDKMDELSEISDGCNEQNNQMGIEEKCEVAHSYAMCMLKEMQSRNYEIPEVEQ